LFNVSTLRSHTKITSLLNDISIKITVPPNALSGLTLQCKYLQFITNNEKTNKDMAT